RSAKKVYIIGEDVRSDDTESYHDTMNMECLELIRKHLGHSRRKLTCHVMFEYQTTFSVFQYSEISNNIKDFIDFKPFNYYDSWAQQVLIGRTEEYLPLEGAEGIRVDSPKQVHLIIVGMSRMGISMAINAAHVAHYPNFDSKGIRTKITFIDKAANEEKDFFMGRFKDLFALSHWSYGNIEEDKVKLASQDVLHNYEHLGGDFLDIEWEFINGSIEKKAVQTYIQEATANENSIVTIAICLPEPNRCLAAALYLDRSVYDKVNQILVYNRYGDSLVTQMTHKHDKQINPYHNKMRAFGMAYDFYNLELVRNIEKLAHRIQDEYNKIYPPNPEEKYGKSEMAKWWSNVYSASTAWCKMRCIGWDGERNLTKDEVNILAKVEHARWNMEQLLMGYRPIDVTKQKELTDITDKKEKKTKKNKLKSQMIHLNICSFNKLEEIDGGSIQVDKGISSIIAEELKGKIAKKIKKNQKQLTNNE
ncbi:MAG: hypothetical protein IIX40_03070, partial [Alistipes sp.]|nr:hypothetical protein [Alistipes sp.]